MKKCTSCGEKVHRSVNICPYCGQEQKENGMKIIAMIMAFIVVLGLSLYFLNKTPNKDDSLNNKKLRELVGLRIEAERVVKTMLKDPNSVEFKDQIGPCGYYNAKNGFGAFTGFKRYIVYEEMKALEDINASSADMDGLWAIACKY